jgi:endonuclease/exonuclease/phosphatase family metal-dependent hydrolase
MDGAIHQPLTIATWNVERPTRRSSRVPALNAEIAKIKPDIIVLTETNECISPGGGYHVHHSEYLGKEAGGDYYKDGERRVSIYSKYRILEHLKVKNPLTTACALLQTPFGNLAVFGCIIGIHGIRDDFDKDLQDQIEDLSRFAAEGHKICYTGDFNLSFCDSYYTKKSARDQLNKIFLTLKMKNLTAEIPQMIDHIVISESFFSEVAIPPKLWNEERSKGKLSDHKGVMVTIQGQPTIR